MVPAGVGGGRDPGHAWANYGADNWSVAGRDPAAGRGHLRGQWAAGHNAGAGGRIPAKTGRTVGRQSGEIPLGWADEPERGRDARANGEADSARTEDVWRRH